MSFIRWVEKEAVVHRDIRIVLGNKKDKLLIHTTTWMNLGGISLSEGSQMQKAIWYMIPFTWLSRKGRITEMESDQWLPRDGVGEAVDYKETVWENFGGEKNSSVWYCRDGYTTIKLSKPVELYTAKSEFYSANFKNQSGCWGTQMECSNKWISLYYKHLT